jgi:adenosylcobinamide-GDP ribazoletransferase
VVVAGDVALTGSLHVDGLTDAADGLLPPLPRARRLEVMRDPSVGAFGAVALVTVLLLRFAVFASVAPSPLLVAALWGGSRTAMAVTTRLVPYARTEGGLASAFGARPSDGQPSDGQPSDDRTPGVPGRQALPGLAAVVLGVAACVALAVLARQVRGFAALSVAAVAFALVVLLARRRIGGFTGDVLGAAGVVGETAGLLVLALRWT